MRMQIASPGPPLPCWLAMHCSASCSSSFHVRGNNAIVLERGGALGGPAGDKPAPWTPRLCATRETKRKSNRAKRRLPATFSEPPTQETNATPREPSAMLCCVVPRHASQCLPMPFDVSQCLPMPLITTFLIVNPGPQT